MAKTTNLYVKFESGLKKQGELALRQLGIRVSNVVNIFLKQVVIQKGIPFNVKLPAINPIVFLDLTEIELNKELEK